MVSIYVNGEDKTRQISDWSIWRTKEGELMLTCHFPSGKKFSSPLSSCSVIPTTEIHGKLLGKKGSSVLKAPDKVLVYGEKYATVQYQGSEQVYVLKWEDIELVPKTEIKEAPIFQYFRSVATSRVEQAKPEDRPVAENVQRQLEKLVPRTDSALHAYCTGKMAAQQEPGSFIYPFGINESQLQAVEQAFTSQISLIEGPPGTGKTQTILNIIANILLRGKSVAILSNNNAAVENVYEKLGKVELDYLVAKLGSKDNRTAFFSNPPARPARAAALAPAMPEIQATLQQLKQQLHEQNEIARLQAEIDELSIERRYLLQWQSEHLLLSSPLLTKYKLSAKKAVDLMAYIRHLAERRISLRDRINLLLGFGIFRTRVFNDLQSRKSVVHALQLHYYDAALLDKNTTLARYRERLENSNFETLLNTLTASSMAHLKQHLHEQIPAEQAFDAKTYRNNFDSFLKRYPIIGSSTHSIVNSIAEGAVIDYIIIDEASQQDIVPGILALGCAKNLVIVGDRKQLPHIPTSLNITSPSKFYDCEKYSLLDSCFGVFNNATPLTLLKEHYRCHPKIIQFCNQQFYENELIPMKRNNGEKALTLVVTAKGNHARGNSNLRELDSLLATFQAPGESAWEGHNARGFISPYRAQVTLSGAHLPAEFVRDTVHKFQGRECEEIVFSTVLDKGSSNQRNLEFVDSPHMVNVAVSRAQNNFTLVTGDDVFAANNGHIAALVRYMEYYAEEGLIHRAPVISAFDLLYKEYDQSLERLNSRLRSEDSEFKSEQIVAQILRETLAQKDYRLLNFHSQIPLLQLASSTNEGLTERELQLMKNGSTCDFVVYFKVGKTPVGVIEVDGGDHDKPEQADRDARKNSILQKSNIPILRLRTVESHIEDKIAAFLEQWKSGSSAT